MKHDAVALIRVTLFGLLIVAFIGCCIVEAGSDAEMTIPETEPTAATTAKTAQEPQLDAEPTFTIPTQQETAPKTEPPTIATEEPTEQAEEWESLGTFQLTAYCPCKKCCGKDPEHPEYGITATGAKAEAGTTIAVDPRVIPYGSTVKINDHIYIAQDTGGAIKKARIDIYFDDHQEASNFGRQWAEIFLKTETR